MVYALLSTELDVDTNVTSSPGSHIVVPRQGCGCKPPGLAGRRVDLQVHVVVNDPVVEHSDTIVTHGSSSPLEGIAQWPIRNTVAALVNRCDAERQPTLMRSVSGDHPLGLTTAIVVFPLLAGFVNAAPRDGTIRRCSLPNPPCFKRLGKPLPAANGVFPLRAD